MIIEEIQQTDIKGFVKTLSFIVLLGLIISLLAAPFALPIISSITIIALAYLVAQFNLASFFMLVVLVIPISTNQKLFDSEVSLLLPSELLEAILTLAFGMKLLLGYKIPSAILKHPIFILMMTGLILQFVATANSTLLTVSIKSMLLKSCYFAVFFVLAADLYQKKSISHFSILKTYLFSLFIIGAIIFVKHFEFGFSKESSGSVTEPFYADHTIYSACLALIIPFPILTFINAKKLNIDFYKRVLIGLIAACMLIFFFYTYCRAGWISFIIALMICISIYLGLRFRGLLLIIISSIGILSIFQNDIADSLKQNKADSNAKNATLEQQTKSVTNISNDQSNAERLNRWSCAWRMFLDKPYLGYGPGTYQFEYLSYQKKSEMTQISITSPYNIKKGKGGTAHSEYLLILSESGIFSFICYILGILAVIYYTIKVYAGSTQTFSKTNIMILFFGFSTYILHAFFNNFLDTDKAAILYYTSIAAIMTEAINLKEGLNKSTT